MIRLSNENLRYKFTEHNKWLRSLGEEGTQLNLDDIDLTKNNMDRKLCSFEQAYIIGCSLEQMDIKKQSFYLSKLYSTSFHRSNLEEVDFTKSDLSYADISNANLCNINFNRCECIESNFKGTKGTDIKFAGGTFDAADLRDAVIRDADVNYSYFENVLVKGIRLKNIRGIENICHLSINIAGVENPKILYGKEAMLWLKGRIVL